jgi:hypothetical protein
VHAAQLTSCDFSRRFVAGCLTVNAIGDLRDAKRARG